MALPYWISKENNKFYLHFKVSQPAGSTRQYTIAKDPNYNPEIPENFWDFFDDFNGNSLDNTIWDDTNASSYSVSDSKLNTWNNWGACCNGSCYYDGIKSIQLYDLPIMVRIAQNQDPYTPASNCGRTGISIAYDNIIQVVTSTDTNDNMGMALRINSTRYSNLGVQRIPDIAPDNFGWSANFGTDRVQIYAYWDDNKGDFEIVNSPSDTTARAIVIAGDTDSTSTVDHLDYIAIARSKPRLPIINIISQTENSVIVEVDDSTTNDGVDLNNLILTVDLTGFITAINEGLNIYSSNVYILFENTTDGKVYYWDGSNWQSIGKVRDELIASDFTNYGSLNIVQINKSQWDTLNNELNVLTYTDQAVYGEDVIVKFQPKDRLVGQIEKINLSDYISIKQMLIYKTGTSNNSETDFYALISRDNENWYKWDGSNFVSVGNNIIDINDENDLNWVKNNGVDIKEYENADVTEWNNFFGNQPPDQLYFVFVINYDSLNANPAIDRIDIIADTDEYWFDDTKSHQIKYTENTISIKFNTSGLFKINYSD